MVRFGLVCRWPCSWSWRLSGCFCLGGDVVVLGEARGVGQVGKAVLVLAEYSALCALLSRNRAPSGHMGERLQAKLNEVKTKLRRRMHAPIPEQGQWLQAVVRGHIQYYGVPMKISALWTFRFQVGWLWHRALSLGDVGDAGPLATQFFSV
jgi:hypothetical protein